MLKKIASVSQTSGGGWEGQSQERSGKVAVCGASGHCHGTDPLSAVTQVPTRQEGSVRGLMVSLSP